MPGYCTARNIPRTVRTEYGRTSTQISSPIRIKAIHQFPGFIYPLQHPVFTIKSLQTVRSRNIPADPHPGPAVESFTVNSEQHIYGRLGIFIGMQVNRTLPARIGRVSKLHQFISRKRNHTVEFRLQDCYFISGNRRNNYPVRTEIAGKLHTTDDIIPHKAHFILYFKVKIRIVFTD